MRFLSYQMTRMLRLLLQRKQLLSKRADWIYEI
jgi:hypothetical protein